MYYLYNKDQSGNYKRIGIYENKEMLSWLGDTVRFDDIRIVSESGICLSISKDTRNRWVIEDIVEEDITIHEGKTFKDFVNKRKMDKQKNNFDKDTPLDQQKHHMKMARGANRKDMNQVPKYRRDAHKGDSAVAKSVLEVAKKASSGIWKISPMQARELADKYKFKIPTTVKKKSKHLGSTGIIMWRKSEKDIYLVKFGKHIHGA